MRFLPFLLLLILPFGALADPLLKKGDPVIGKVNGIQIRLSELEDKEINDLRVKLYTTLNDKLRAKALSELGKKDKTYREPPVVNVSDKAAKAFYDKNNLAQRGPYDQLKPQIVQYLTIQQMQAYVDKLYQKAIDQRKVQIYLEKPKVLLVELPIETAYLWGKKNAKVMLLEFSDYQCPFCGRVQENMVEIRKAYKNKALFGYRHFPLQFHEQADDAALAVECARDQGKFEAYHELLFKNQTAQHDPELLAYAKKVGIKNQAQFKRCLTSKKHHGQVQRDMALAASIGIRGTPSFVIGHYNPKTKTLRGEMMSGAMPKAELTKVLDKYLAQ